MKPAKKQSALIAELIPVTDIEPVYFGQPRKFFDQERLQELADSIRETKGVIEPIVVRPRVAAYGVLNNTKGQPQVVFLSNESDNLIRWDGPSFNRPSEAQSAAEAKNKKLKPYELVAGERRWRAAKMAGLTEIAATVRTLDKKTVLEIQVIENLQRQDLSPLEEAQGFGELVGSHGYTAESLAKKIGKSRAYIYGMLKLNSLPEIAVRAINEGTISKSHGELIARLPNEKLREKFANQVIAGSRRWDNESMSYITGPLSLRETKAVQESQYMVELKGAPFSIKDAKLVAEAGACSTCPKMTGNARDLFPDGRADMCTDPVCYSSKVSANANRLSEAAKTEGLTVLDGKEAEKIFDYCRSELPYGSAYVDFASQCYEDKKRRSYKQLLGESLKPVVIFDAMGQMHKLVKKADAAPVLKEKGISASASMGQDRSYQERERKARELEKIRTLAVRRAIEKIGGKEMPAKVKSPFFLVSSLISLLDTNLEEVLSARGVKGNRPNFEKLDELLRSEDDAVAFALQVVVSCGLKQWARSWYMHNPQPKKAADRALKQLGITMDSLLLAAKREIQSSKGKKRLPAMVDLAPGKVLRSRQTLPAAALEIAEATYSADRLPKLKGIFRYGGTTLVSIGGLSSGSEGILEVEAYRLVPSGEYRGTAKGEGRPGPNAYSGREVEFRGQKFRMVGPAVIFEPEKAAKKKTSPVSKARRTPKASPAAAARSVAA